MRYLIFIKKLGKYIYNDFCGYPMLSKEVLYSKSFVSKNEAKHYINVLNEQKLWPDNITESDAQIYKLEFVCTPETN